MDLAYREGGEMMEESPSPRKEHRKVIKYWRSDQSLCRIIWRADKVGGHSSPPDHSHTKGGKTIHYRKKMDLAGEELKANTSHMKPP